MMTLSSKTRRVVSQRSRSASSMTQYGVIFTEGFLRGISSSCQCYIRLNAVQAIWLNTTQHTALSTSGQSHGRHACQQPLKLSAAAEVVATTRHNCACAMLHSKCANRIWMCLLSCLLLLDCVHVSEQRNVAGS